MHAEHEGRRVLMTADTVGGVWDYALELAEGARRARRRGDARDHGAAPCATTSAPAARAIPSLRLVESDYRLEWIDDPWDDVARAGDVAAGSRGAACSPTSCT